MRGGYRIAGSSRLAADHADFVIRRTRPFAVHGLHLPIQHLLGEAYVQGMRDTLDALAAGAQPKDSA